MPSSQVQSHVEQKQKTLMQVCWEDIDEPGAYVEVQTGRLLRIPQEALLAGSSPLIRQECTETPTYIQLSKSPFITEFQARMLAAEHNVEPNF